MLLDVVLIVVGVALVLFGADRLTEGASALARRMNVPEIIIGLTIVAAGTSAPELFVSLVSALKGTPDLAVGNVVGSNTMNAMLIVGCAAMVAPMTISRSTVKKDIPFSVGASVLLILLAVDSFLGRVDGIILLLGFAVFMAYTLMQAKTGSTDEVQAETSPVWKNIVYLVGGLLGLVLGSNLFVDSASSVAYALDISEGVVGLTVVAGGTSLPELATSVVAARKGQSAIAIGNVIGSNVFNILLILGLTATISPMEIEGITTIDMAVMLISVALVWMFSFTRYTVERWEGAVLVGGYLVYLCWLISSL
ncbi:MAG: calcium/sodium antiporter [Prevotella sp.]|nr:calcium/sodium antiporter [Muribaculaceae bacterium]MBQ5493612.1 calcium/sodium antiporter [Prevotella sp.]MBQ5547917.1 calcium/sodium antiporter [Prevotella sp.]